VADMNTDNVTILVQQPELSTVPGLRVQMPTTSVRISNRSKDRQEVFSLLFIIGTILWIVFGLIILIKSDQLMYESRCRANECWWLTTGEYIATGCCIVIHIFRLYAGLEGSECCKKFTQILVALIHITTAVYSIILLDAMHKDTIPGYEDCHSWLHDQYDDPTSFMVLFTFNAALAFLAVLLLFCQIICYGR